MTESALDSVERLVALRASGLLDSPAEEAFDRLTRLAARLLNAPIALVSMVDDTRQFFKSAYGLVDPWATQRGTPHSHSFCKIVVTGGELIVTDARTDERVRGNLAITELNVLSYVGVPLTTLEGETLGAFCVIDNQPRPWTEDQLAVLRDLGAAATAEIRLRSAMKAIDAREKTLQAIIETASAGILVRQLDGKITRVNKTFCEMIGYSEAEVMELDIVAITHADDAPIDEAFRKELIDGKRSKVRRTKRYRHKNGAFVWVELSVSLLRDASGVPEATVAIVQDMTETMRLRQEVQRRDEMYKTIVQNIPNATILLYDRDFRFISADGARVRGGAADPKTLVGKMVADVVPPENRPRILAQYKATLDGESAVGEYLIQGRAYAVHTVPVRDETGSILAGMVFSYDTTTQHKQSNEFRAATTRLSALIDHLSAGVLFEDESRSVQLVNNAFCAMFGIADFGKIIGSNALALPEVKSKLIDPEGFTKLSDIRVSEAADVDADRVALVDGRFLDRSYAPVEVPGVSSGHLWLYRDVTERENQRAMLAAQTAELERLSTRDELTHLYNRRGFMMIAEQALKSAARGKRRIILFFADMNGMKQINDTLGHKVGDAALVDCANILRQTFRDADLIARLGGDEFVALAVDAMPEHAKTIQSRLQANFEALNDEPNRKYRITVSVGSSIFDPDETRPIEDLVAEADALMYEQKRARPMSARHAIAKKNG